MQVTFYGTRGSLAVPGPRTVRYGGNTSCCVVRSARDTLVVLDMGTGAYALGQELVATGRKLRGHVLITHTHWDHIQGLPFFAPFFRPGNEWDIYAPRGLGPSLRETLAGQMQHVYFPLELEQLGATIRYHDLVEGTLAIDDVAVEAHYLNHTALTLGYRLTADGCSVVYALDHEPFAPSLASGEGPIEGSDRRHVEFLRGADLVIHDAQYTAAEYATKIGWGHSTVEYALLVAREAGTPRLCIAHHDPQRSDDDLDALLEHYRPGAEADDIELFAATEGHVLTLVPDQPARRARAKPEPPTAAAQPALADQAVLVAGDDAERVASLVAVLEEDQVPVRGVAPDDAADVVTRWRPTLLVLVDDDPDSAAARIRDVRRAGEAGRDVAIALVSRDESGPSNEVLGIIDRLAGPFTPTYARARLRAWLMRRACLWALPPSPPAEKDRLAALKRLEALDAPPNERLEHLALLARDLFEAPIAAVTLIDEDRQWFAASCGLGERQTPRDESFCAHVVASPGPLEVPDAAGDPRFADHPAVAGPARLRYYAGHPLILSSGHCVGAFCIADVKPRRIGDGGMANLSRLAELARDILESARETEDEAAPGGD
ncbi:MBL fold metallo-hydrolase [Alsobacter sp. SYSU M60028]|uniref:MBL fold metallo-hydrolase n=1 Tax=Alsobacter ponti TaxID=2962936 RepID=A0ABT1L7Q2_9HYPH|nr:MBL fold metallo-hydrolase [Alsobacter ponti]MCP8937517.1 MBL fold metallo-hydrolase [Alsobacter ponti]